MITLPLTLYYTVSLIVTKNNTIWGAIAAVVGVNAVMIAWVFAAIKMDNTQDAVEEDVRKAKDKLTSKEESETEEIEMKASGKETTTTPRKRNTRNKETK